MSANRQPRFASLDEQRQAEEAAKTTIAEMNRQARDPNRLLVSVPLMSKPAQSRPATPTTPIWRDKDWQFWIKFTVGTVALGILGFWWKK